MNIILIFFSKEQCKLIKNSGTEWKNFLNINVAFKPRIATEAIQLLFDIHICFNFHF